MKSFVDVKRNPAKREVCSRKVLIKMQGKKAPMVQEVLLLAIGTALVAVGVYFFKEVSTWQNLSSAYR